MDALHQFQATPEGAAVLLLVGGVGLKYLTELVKLAKVKATSNKLVGFTVWLVTFIFANAATASAMALQLLPHLSHTRFAAYAAALTGVAVGFHEFATSGPFQKAKQWWTDMQAGKDARLAAANPLLVANEPQPEQPASQPFRPLVQ